MTRTACVVAAATLFAAPAFAQTASSGPACVKRADLIKHLEAKYHEAPSAVGLADNGALLEVFSSKSGDLDGHRHDAERHQLHGRDGPAVAGRAARGAGRRPDLRVFAPLTPP